MYTMPVWVHSCEAKEILRSRFDRKSDICDKVILAFLINNASTPWSLLVRRSLSCSICSVALILIKSTIDNGSCHKASPNEHWPGSRAQGCEERAQSFRIV